MNKDNNIIIHDRENTIILYSTESGVVGGYYDNEGTWHDLSGSSFKKYKLKVPETPRENSSAVNITVLLTIENSTFSSIPDGTLLGKISFPVVEPKYGMSCTGTSATNTLVNGSLVSKEGVISSGLENAIFTAYYVPEDKYYFDSYFEEI